MNQFAHLFEFTDLGQILVVRDTNDGDDDHGTVPCIKITFTTPDTGLNVMKLLFADDEDEERDEAFDKLADPVATYDLMKEQVVKLSGAFSSSGKVYADD
ncbi:hypothetical protein hairong_044 [Pseudomonas phage hairong]|nr:hypothetical protein hairong_044 [Pseudomonas phage hairong]